MYFYYNIVEVMVVLWTADDARNAVKTTSSMEHLNTSSEAHMRMEVDVEDLDLNNSDTDLFDVGETRDESNSIAVHSVKRKRGKKKCPVCGERVVHIPRHLQGKHKWTKEDSQRATCFFGLRKPYKSCQRKRSPKFKDYHQHRHCPLTACGAVVKRLPPHLKQVHGISKASPVFAKLLQKAKNEIRNQKLQLNYGLDISESQESTDDTAVSGDETQSEYAANSVSVEMSNEDHNDSNTDLLDSDRTHDHSNSSDPTVINWLEFEKWLLSADGGRASQKSARQHCVQAQTVLRNTTSKNLSALWNKRELRHFVDNYAAKKKHLPGTVKSYLSSIRHCYVYLLTETSVLSPEEKTTIHQMKDCVGRWMQAYRRESRRRGLERNDTDMQKLISPQQIVEFEKSPVALKAIKLIGCAVDNEQKCHVTQAAFVLVRDFVITETVISNASRSGAIANVTAEEFAAARTRNDQVIVSVRNHKTAHCHGPAKLVLSLTLHGWLQAYFKHFRSHVCNISSDPHLFLSWNGDKLSSGQVTRAVQAAWSKAGLGNAITCTLVRKTAVSAVHQKRPELKGNLADLMCHRVDTADRSYRLVQREQTSAAAARELGDILREQPPTTTASSVLANDSRSDRRSDQVPCEQQAAASDDSSDGIVPPSTHSAREHSIFSSNDVAFLTQVFNESIRSGHIRQTHIMNTLQKSTTGDALLKRFSVSQIIARLKYERLKLRRCQSIPYHATSLV